MKIIKLYLRLAIAIGFLSASADRLGMWPKEHSAWGDWENFLAYTHLLNPWFPDALIPAVGFLATGAEIILAIFLIIGFKTEYVAKLSGIVLLLFAVSMTLTIGIKTVFDYSVFSASAAAFALSLFKEKYLEVDSLFIKNGNEEKHRNSK